MIADLNDNVTAEFKGAELKEAQSSLHSFGLTFANGKGIVLSATLEKGDSAMNLPDELSIATEIKAAETMPKLAEAVCSVDWSWIYGSQLVSMSRQAGPRGAAIVIKLDPVGPITVSVGAWEGKPFLSFMPYKKP